MTEIRENRAKRRLQRGETVTAVSGFNTADMIDSMGPLGFDAFWIEGEHGPVDFAEIPDVTRACDLWGRSSIVRVNLNLPGVIYRTLDVGAQGIVVPHVNTAEEARAVVDAAKFHPLGNRGNFTSRQGYGVADYASKANDETLVIVLIEDVVAIDNLDEIIAVDHIDVFFVAPGDLAQTMGYLGAGGAPGGRRGRGVGYPAHRVRGTHGGGDGVGRQRGGSDGRGGAVPSQHVDALAGGRRAQLSRQGRGGRLRLAVFS